MKETLVIVFEDEHYSFLNPIALSHPVYNILAGTKTNYQRIEHYFNEYQIATVCREYLAPVYGSLTKESLDSSLHKTDTKVVLVNGRIALFQKDIEFITELKNCTDFTSFNIGNTLAAAVIPSSFIRELTGLIISLHNEGTSLAIKDISNKNIDVELELFNYIWESMPRNQRFIESDFNEYYKDNQTANSIGDSYLYNNNAIANGSNISADAASVIDARSGPVIIESGVEIKPFCYLEGPAYIGNECKLVGGKITGGCSFGPGCRIGGEVENSIVIGNSNKYHEGFLGHAYLGEWVNLGALTTNSDLKNNYSEISVKLNGKVTKTGSNKIGSFIGDHSKTGIGTTLNTGIVIGCMSNLFGGSLIVEKEIPSYAWGNDALRHEYSLAKALDTAWIVLERREQVFDVNQKKMFDYIYADTKEARQKWLIGKRR
ncbi:MAG: hypothetical protein GY855_07575 [candidate division Zixibacteria bacterium]|nr:hypothetical protein [candidate division Zixibacteria bacterium]